MGSFCSAGEMAMVLVGEGNARMWVANIVIIQRLNIMSFFFGTY